MFGLLHLSFLEYFIAILILTQLTIASVSLYLHRCQAHRAVEFHPIMSHFFRFWLWLTTGMNTKEWTAIHRKHHAKCETREDPHSPQILGIKKVLWEGAELYRKESFNRETMEYYGKGTPQDGIELQIYSKYPNSGLFLMLGIDLLLFGVPGITIWALQMIWIPFFAAGIINGIGHYWGYRNYECPEAAYNILPWGIIVCGEELHNNHHTFGSSAKFSSKWWEFDLGWAYVKLLSWLRLAKIKKIAPRLLKCSGKNTIDDETLKALIINRFNILSYYGKEVIIPLLKAEKERAGKTSGGIFYKANILLIREPLLINKIERKRLALLLKNFPKLRQVYYYRKQLQMITKRKNTTASELIEMIKKWCYRAEMSDNKPLIKFLFYLKMYSSTPINRLDDHCR